MFGIFKKKSREEKMKLHSEKVFLLLTSDQEESFNFIETTEILNEVRRKYNEYLKSLTGKFPLWRKANIYPCKKITI